MTRVLTINVDVHINSVTHVEAAVLSSGALAITLTNGESIYPNLTMFGMPDELNRLLAAMTKAVATAALHGEGTVVMGDTFGLRVPSKGADPLESGTTSHGHPEHHPDDVGPFDTPGACLTCATELADDTTSPDPELCDSCYEGICSPPYGMGAA